MTLSQILELITSSLGNLVFQANGAPATTASGTTGILKGFGYVIGLVTPASTNFSPLIFFCVMIAFVGFGIGLIKRIIKL